MPAPSLSRKRRRWALIVVVATVLLGGCDTALDRPNVPTVPTGPGAPTAVTTTQNTVSITPVTPDGLLTGPGIDDTSMTLGVLVDPDRDRGFTEGLQLWRQVVNTSGGLCGRTVRLSLAGADGIPDDLVEAYETIGLSSIGLITLPPPTQAVALNSRIAADQIPTLTPTGTSTQLGPGRPIVIGPTEDILAINGLDYLEQAGRIEEGATIGVLTDGSATADNALTGARWWAAERGMTLDVRTVDDAEPGQLAGSADLSDWAEVTHVLALTSAALTGELVERAPASVTVLTTIDGYDPAAWSSSALAAAEAGRVLVTTAAPAFGSDYPAAVAVASRAAAGGVVNPGPRLLDGYATGVGWARLLTQACTDRTLTRRALEQAATTVGPASVDSLFGPSDPSLAVLSGLPATRVSAVSAATPSAPSGIAPLTWLEGASGIEEYVP